jgi:hypothetical protein
MIMSIGDVTNQNPTQNVGAQESEKTKGSGKTFSTWNEFESTMTKEERNKFLTNLARPWINRLNDTLKESKRRRKAEEST